MGFYVAQFLTGLASASALFLVASGLTLIFGVTRIVNFAHGSLFMLGAYLGYSLIEVFPATVLGFWGAVICASVAVGAIGAAIEVLILRRIYKAPELFQLVATFGVVLIVQDAALWIWGPEDLLGPRAPGLDGVVTILGEPIPEYDLALIAVGPAVLGLIWIVLHRTRFGLLIRAAVDDREMLAALGVNQQTLFTGVFFAGSALAGLGGALQVPREAVSLLMDLNIIAEAFVVTVIGGMGSVVGAFLAAVLIGELNAFGILILPQITLVLAFLVMAAVLILRPQGLLGRPETVSPHGGDAPARPLVLLSARGRMAAAGLLGLLLVLPVLAGPFAIVLLTDILIFALFAASLQYLMGIAGMISFGHAAYFGLGAYGAALLTTYFDLAMTAGLVLGPLLALAAAAIFGVFCIRLGGVYLAMLTLAAAQIVWSVAVQWTGFTGGDDGLIGVWPADWASDKTAYYYLSLCLVGLALFALRHLAHSPFGLTARAIRDSGLRAESIGIETFYHRWASFALAGAFAGLAGALFVYSKGSVFPDELAIPRSVDALVMVLLGGLHSLTGPLLGALAFVGLEDLALRTEYWRFLFGLVIVGICLVAPDGIAGSLRRMKDRML